MVEHDFRACVLKQVKTVITIIESIYSIGCTHTYTQTPIMNHDTVIFLLSLVHSPREDFISAAWMVGVQGQPVCRTLELTGVDYQAAEGHVCRVQVEAGDQDEGCVWQFGCSRNSRENLCLWVCAVKKDTVADSFGFNFWRCSATQSLWLFLGGFFSFCYSWKCSPEVAKDKWQAQPL